MGSAPLQRARKREENKRETKAAEIRRRESMG